MKRLLRYAAILGIITAPAFLVELRNTPVTSGQERLRWDNGRAISEEPHPRLIRVTEDGDAVVPVLEDGSFYRQIALNPGLDKVTWDDAYWYVCDGRVIWEADDIQAVSRCTELAD
ncbi:MAG TPA: hypothetical protein VD862_03525 [Candidatus Paceibacterota bacterium]|nr:hypothetical protein [Candidatus Paceibacterota bacterium]